MDGARPTAALTVGTSKILEGARMELSLELEILKFS